MFRRRLSDIFLYIFFNFLFIYMFSYSFTKQNKKNIVNDKNKNLNNIGKNILI